MTTYDVTIITVRPGTHPAALGRLQHSLGGAASELLACWYSDLGAINQILLIRSANDAAAVIEQRAARLTVARSVRKSVSSSSPSPWTPTSRFHSSDQ